jgi:hypothetical protein
MKTYGGGGIAPCILNLGSRWSVVVSFTSRGKSPRYTLYRELVGPQSRSGRDGKEKNSYPYWESNPASSSYLSYYTDSATPVTFSVARKYHVSFGTVL